MSGVIGVIGENNGRERNSRSYISGSNYSQSLDELLGFSKPPIPVPRRG